MTCKGFAGFAIHQNFYALNAGNVHGQRFHQRIHGELLDLNAGAMLVGKGGVEVDNRRSRIDQNTRVRRSDVGASGCAAPGV